MTITANDIKLFASERLNDDADGGGYMTGTIIQDGVENNLFPDISEVDRATGAVDYRKFFTSVTTTDTDTYFGAHVILDTLPGDPAVSAVLCASDSQSELRSDLITRLNLEADDAAFYSTKALTVSGGVDDRTVEIGSIRSTLIPPSVKGVAVGGIISPNENSLRYCRPYVGFSITDRSDTVGGGDTPGGMFFSHPRLGTLEGEGLDNDVFFVKLDGEEYLYRFSTGLTQAKIDAGFGNALKFEGPRFYGDAYYQAKSFVPTYRVPLPVVTDNRTFTPTGTNSRAYTLAHLSAEASETVTWEDALGNFYTLQNLGPSEFVSTEHGTASVDRATGLLVVEFLTLPDTGSDVVIKYCRKDQAEVVTEPTWVASEAVLDITTGYVLAEANFVINGRRARVVGSSGTVRYQDIDESGAVPVVVDGDVIGTYDAGSKTLSVVGATDLSVSQWFAVQVFDAATTATGTKVTAQIPSSIEPTSLTISGLKSTSVPFTTSCDADGYFADAYVTGRYYQDSGALVLEFTTAAKLSSLSYSGTQVSTGLVPESIAGVDPSLFPSNGRVQVFRSGDIVVCHNTQALAPLTVTNGQTVSCGRTRISNARVFGDDDVEITTGFTFNQAAGTVTFSDVTGYVQPVTIHHRVEDVSAATTVDESGTISLSRPLTHTYPSGSSFLSSALLIGDMQARAHLGFQMQTWLGVWADDLDGSGGVGILADYNEAAFPIQVQNRGTVTERWAVIFTNTTAYRIVGEQVGQIAVGDTSSDVSPLNPATGTPYFTIQAEGWGSGWAGGNVYRFNTDGGASPAWAIRTIAPSDAYPTVDSVTIAARGSINA